MGDEASELVREGLFPALNRTHLNALSVDPQG